MHLSFRNNNILLKVLNFLNAPKKLNNNWIGKTRMILHKTSFRALVFPLKNIIPLLNKADKMVRNNVLMELLTPNKNNKVFVVRKSTFLLDNQLKNKIRNLPWQSIETLSIAKNQIVRKSFRYKISQSIQSLYSRDLRFQIPLVKLKKDPLWNLLPFFKKADKQSKSKAISLRDF